MQKDRCQQVSFSLFLDQWNRSQNQQTPHVHARIAIWLQKCWARGDRRLILQAFRACGKSTLAGIFSAWALYRDPDLRILVLAAESRLSNKMVRQIRKLIERHPLTAHLIPTNPDEWAADSFTVNRKKVSRDPSVLGRGLFSNVTGTRADFIICDDVEVPNTCDTSDKRAKLRERLLENEFILTPGGRQMYIGTPHSFYSIYAKMPRKDIGEDSVFLKNYRRLLIPIVDGNGQSTWPERYSSAEIEEMRLQSGPMKFASQMMLEPVNILDGRLDTALLQRYDDALEYFEAQQEMILSIAGKRIVSASAWWDPSFASAKGDASVVAVIYTSEDGKYHLHRMEYIRVDAGDGEDEATLQCQHVARMAQELYLPSITIETNGIGQFLPAILKREMAALHVPCAVQARSSTKAKDIRILESFDAVMAAKSIYVHISVYQTRFINEMQEWRPGAKGAKDDGLDAAAGALSLEPVRVRKSYTNVTRTWRSQKAHKARTDFDVLT